MQLSPSPIIEVPQSRRSNWERESLITRRGLCHDPWGSISYPSVSHPSHSPKLHSGLLLLSAALVAAIEKPKNTLRRAWNAYKQTLRVSPLRCQN